MLPSLILRLNSIDFGSILNDDWMPETSLVGLATPYMTPYMNLDPLRLLHGPQTPYTNTHSGARIRTPGKAQVQGMQITQPEY